MPEDVFIHSTAIVHEGAQLGVGVSIGPYAIIGPKVVLEDAVKVEAHAIVSEKTRIGAGSHIYSFASIGSVPQDKKYKGEETELICGKNNVFREYSNVSTCTAGGGAKTQLGDGNLLMIHTHVAHDCIIGNNCILANGVSLAGHVEIGDSAVLGGHSAVHQFCKIGTLGMLAAGAMVAQDVPPFVLVHGDHAKPSGLNLIGLKRANWSSDEIQEIKKMYRLLYSSTLTLEDTIQSIHRSFKGRHADLFLQFLRGSVRGICR